MAAQFQDGKMYVVASGFFPEKQYADGENTQQSPSQMQDFPLPRELVESFLQEQYGIEIPADMATQWEAFALEHLERHKGFSRQDPNCRMNGRGPFQWECRRRRKEVHSDDMDED